MPGVDSVFTTARPVSVIHCGFLSVFTSIKARGHDRCGPRCEVYYPEVSGQVATIAALICRARRARCARRQCSEINPILLHDERKPQLALNKVLTRLDSFALVNWLSPVSEYQLLLPALLALSLDFSGPTKTKLVRLNIIAGLSLVTPT